MTAPVLGPTAPFPLPDLPLPAEEKPPHHFAYPLDSEGANAAVTQEEMDQSDTRPSLFTLKPPVAPKDAPPAPDTTPHRPPPTPAFTPPQALRPPMNSPATTPGERFTVSVTKTPRHRLTSKDCLPRKLRGYLRKHPNTIYSEKIEEKLPNGTTRVQRYVGQTGTFEHRIQQHISAANHPKGNSSYAKALQNLTPEKRSKTVRVSFGILASPTPESLDESENQAIQKVQKKYGKNTVLNERSGGGGGSPVRKISLLTDTQIQRKLPPLLKKLIWHDLEKTKENIHHTIPRTSDCTGPVIYYFKRDMMNGTSRGYVGLTVNLKRRLSSHLSYASHVKNCQRKDKEFYEHLSKNWRQFQIGFVSVRSLIDQGATLHKVETVAIKLLKTQKFPDGSGGYNCNAGGGGGAGK